MKNNTTQSAASSFAITFTSANPNEYPVIYAEDQWHTANKSDKICQLYDVLHRGSNTSASGAQFTQREINETLANTATNTNSSISQVSNIVDKLQEQVNGINTSLVNVYRFMGSVEFAADLTSLSHKSKPGDVYNVTTTGMNYAFVGVPLVLHLEDKDYTGMELSTYAKECVTNTKTARIKVQGTFEDCTIGATKDSDGNYRLYAFVGTLSGNPSTVQGTFVDLESYDETDKTYTEINGSVKYCTIPTDMNMWDALGANKGITLWEE